MSTDFDERRGEIQMLFERELSGIDTVYLPDDGERIDSLGRLSGLLNADYGSGYRI